VLTHGHDDTPEHGAHPLMARVVQDGVVNHCARPNYHRNRRAVCCLKTRRTDDFSSDTIIYIYIYIPLLYGKQRKTPDANIVHRTTTIR